MSAQAGPGPDTTRTRSDAARRGALEREVAIQTARGARIESRGAFAVVLVRGLRLHNNHGLRLNGGERRSRVVVDEFGVVRAVRVDEAVPFTGGDGVDMETRGVPRRT